MAIEIVLCMFMAFIGICVGQQYALHTNKKIRHSMGHDELTDMYSIEHLKTKARQFKGDKITRYVICTNISEFKLINELFGREKGNEILIKLANNIRGIVEPSTLYGRMSADHFIMLVKEEYFTEDKLKELSSSMRNSIKSSEFKLRLQFGIYKTNEIGEGLMSMCDRAAMAAATIKSDTQEFIAYYDEAMLEQAIKTKRTIDEFDSAMKNGEFKMFLQAQVSANNHGLIGAEALVRRIKADGTIVSPADFIPVYEKTGLICRLDLFIWEEAIKTLRRWSQDGIRCRISVNISPRDFYYMNVAKTIKAMAKRYSVTPDKLNIEITESALMSNVPGLDEGVNELKESGFTVEIDDFGSGYSSLNSLKDIDIDVLKIDMGFLRKTENNERGRIILDSVISMAKRLNMQVITEGVETIEQANMLNSMGCDYLQGYYFSKPISVESYEEKYFSEFHEDIKAELSTELAIENDTEEMNIAIA